MNLEESFFLGKLPQFMPSAGPSATTADAAEFVDQTWVYGQNQYPGGCNPNYSYSFAVRACLGVYTETGTAGAVVAGDPMCVYNAGQDEQLRVGNYSGVLDK
jgi:hypothetical protein